MDLFQELSLKGGEDGAGREYTNFSHIETTSKINKSKHLGSPMIPCWDFFEHLKYAHLIKTRILTNTKKEL